MLYRDATDAEILRMSQTALEKNHRIVVPDLQAVHDRTLGLAVREMIDATLMYPLAELRALVRECDAGTLANLNLYKARDLLNAIACALQAENETKRKENLK